MASPITAHRFTAPMAPCTARARHVRRFGAPAAVCAIALTVLCGSALARVPVAKLTDYSGTVEISSDGKQWRPVTRAKLLFAGTEVRTGADGHATVIAEANNASLELRPQALVEVRASDVRIVSGDVAAPRADSGLFGFFSDLQRRWEGRQRYTTVRRGVNNAWEVETANAVTASDDYPQLAWQNGGSDVSYRITVDSQVFSAPAAAAAAPYVTFALHGIAPGEHQYRIEVLDASGAVKYTDKDGGKLTWLDAQKSHTLQAQHHALLADHTKDDEQIAENEE